MSGTKDLSGLMEVLVMVEGMIILCPLGGGHNKPISRETMGVLTKQVCSTKATPWMRSLPFLDGKHTKENEDQVALDLFIYYHVLCIVPSPMAT